MITNKKDMIGKRFGSWIVIAESGTKDNTGCYEYLCKCDCGVERIVSGRRLRSGGSQSCGCENRKKIIIANKKRKKDLIGQRFGKLLVLEEDTNINHERTTWKCQCDCGNITFVTSSDLITGNTKSCGCMRSSSYGENKIQTILKEQNITYIKEYTNNTCKFPDTQYLARFDFYLPKYNTIIEYNGQQHYIQGTGNYDNLYKIKNTQQHDKFKQDWCKANNINLICIPYTEYENINIDMLLPNTSQFLVK